MKALPKPPFPHSQSPRNNSPSTERHDASIIQFAWLAKNYTHNDAFSVASKGLAIATANYVLFALLTPSDLRRVF